ncbi:MAG: hypothetical protein C4547_04760 [Phycisphaerales bacterium]|nr:MAG: hypothetical protein C4547_04760 [Phycisphaerales bacterium]
MGRITERLCSFWQAEEVPRWFGISVVVIYLASLAGVAHVGMRYADEDRGRTFRQAVETSHELLADRLGAVEGASEDPAARAATLQRILRRYAAVMSVSALRVVDGQRQVVASIDASEIGSASPLGSSGSLTPDRLEIVDLPAEMYGRSMRLLRSPLRSDYQATGLYLEGVSSVDAPAGAELAEHADTLVVVLCACGALLVIYRRLRRQMRGVARIARQLRQHGDRIEQELGALRIADSAGALARQWNQLIDTVESLQDELKRTRATSELSKVLSRSGGGALAEALNALPSGVLHVNDEGRIEYANAAGRRFFDLGSAGDAPALLAELHPGEAAAPLLEVVRRASQDDGTFEPKSEICEIGADQSSYRVRIFPLGKGAAGSGCMVIVDDVSQQVRAEKAREDFVSQVTHELRTPLTNIRAYAETLSSGMFDDPKVMTECYNVITKETRRLSRLIDDILSVSQMEVGSIQLQIGEVDLKTLLTDSVRDVRGLAEEKNIDLRLTLPAKLETLKADRDKLAVVINNLLGNALKYTRESGTVIVGCQLGPSEAIITVKDNGIGIAPADQQRVFEKFQRAHDPEVQNQTGSGVGLYTAREIVRGHGGDIDLISEKGSGSTFIVRLPHVASRAGTLSSASGN